MFETATWLEQFRGEPVSVLEGALAAQAWEQRRDDDAGQREADERAQAAEERAEGLHLANRALGNPVGEIASLRSALVGVDDEVAELRERLAKAERKRRAYKERYRANWHSEPHDANDHLRLHVSSLEYSAGWEGDGGLQVACFLTIYNDGDYSTA